MTEQEIEDLFNLQMPQTLKDMKVCEKDWRMAMFIAAAKRHKNAFTFRFNPVALCEQRSEHLFDAVHLTANALSGYPLNGELVIMVKKLSDRNYVATSYLKV